MVPQPSVYVLELEAIGHNVARHIREADGLLTDFAAALGRSLEPGRGSYPTSWVARILGPDLQFRYRREFLRPTTDYSGSNSVGSRGIVLRFVLSEGDLYEVQDRYRWRQIDRYFARVREGRLERLDPELFEDLVWRRERERRRSEEGGRGEP